MNPERINCLLSGFCQQLFAGLRGNHKVRVAIVESRPVQAAVSVTTAVTRQAAAVARMNDAVALTQAWLALNPVNAHIQFVPGVTVESATRASMRIVFPGQTLSTE